MGTVSKEFRALKHLSVKKKTSRRLPKKRCTAQQQKVDAFVRKRMQILRQQKKESYRRALDNCQTKVTEMAVSLKEEFGSHSISHYRRAILQDSQLRRNSRAIRPYDVFLARELKAANLSKFYS
jgi:hypothetical protein